MARDAQPAPSIRDAFIALLFVGVAMWAQFVAWSVFDEAGGDWMHFVGGGGRSPAVPMWVIFGMDWALTLFSAAVVVAYVWSVVRYVRETRLRDDAREAAPVSPVD
ncbi:hypothetical protein [Agromyces mariniharenae]|uniref:Uncharacterized protein n=1 Tax=Agromyces mariniharenae TaxID=2604423 RepID=A0A5S4VAF2_9MICO|nr:hypothetical protein [Agromyces mariniharenae]TYL51045.1 hypothetical protein FYC51_18105 [Agromyces mariniharenae]